MHVEVKCYCSEINKPKVSKFIVSQTIGNGMSQNPIVTSSNVSLSVRVYIFLQFSVLNFLLIQPLCDPKLDMPPLFLFSIMSRSELICRY